MSSAQPRLLPYLATVHSDWLATDPDSLWRQVDGSLLFADVSGFTPLAERLARRGKVGAEELTDILNAMFGQLLEVAAEYGGDCLKFGGDALLLLFQHAGHPVRARRAAQCMLDVVRSFRRLATTAGTVRLGMSAGLHCGPVLLTLAGSHHKELMVVGPVVTETLAREASAAAGSVEVSPAAVSEGAVLVRPARTGSVDEMSPYVADPALPVRLGLDAAAARGIPPVLADHLTGEPHEGEHRLAAMGFVQFGETDRLLAQRGPDGLAAALDGLVQRVQEAADEHGVTFLASDVDKGAGKLFLAAGVPSGSSDDEDRLLHTLRAIVSGGGELPLRAGANRGRVFAVDLGGPHRRAFTVIGDATNLAARIMGHADWGQVLASRDLLDRVRTNFEITPVVPFAVKGKSHPVDAGVVGEAVGLRAEANLDGIPLVGRTHELAVIREAFGRAYEGMGSVVELVGEPGIGKSKLVAAAREIANMPTLVIRGGRYSRATPYFAIRGALRYLLGIEASSTPSEVATIIPDIVSKVTPDLNPWLPLIGSAIGVDLPDTPETTRLDIAFRAAKLRETVANLVGRLLVQPALWVVEDAHWLDAASSEFLTEMMVLAERRPWAFLITRRPIEDGPIAPERLGQRLELGPLPASESASLVSASLTSAASTLPPGTLDELVARSGGNPLFIQELVAAATRQALSELPETIEAVVSASIDTLAAEERALLRRAAVLGAHFPLSVLARTLDVEQDEIISGLDRLRHFLRSDGNGGLAFRHVLLRDVAYEGLPYRTRRKLHGRAGEVWEAEAGSQPEDVAELLSVHFHAAGRYAESWRYSEEAGRRSERRAALIEAAAFYERALQAARHLPVVSAEQQATVAERLGDMTARSGRYTDSRSAYQRARRLSSGPIQAARVTRKVGIVWEQEGRFPDSARACKRGLRILDGLDSMPGAVKERAKLLAEYGVVMLRQGRHLQALPILEESAGLARSGDPAENRAALARAYRYLDWLYIELGQSAPEPYSAMALELYEAAGDETGRSAALSNMGIAAYYRGDWDEAVALYERSREAAGRAGAVISQANELNNIAEILSDQGHISEAEALLRDALDIWRSAHHRFEGMTLGNLGRAAARDGRFDEAADWYRQAVDFLQRIGENSLLVETKARQGELLVLAGRPADAINGIEELDRQSVRTALPYTLSLIDRVAGYALLQLGDLRAGSERMSRSVMRSRENSDEYGTALGLEGLARIIRLRGSSRGADGLASEAEKIFSRLGVVRTPEVPLAAIGAVLSLPRASLTTRSPP